jgi:hypothetical protein
MRCLLLFLFTASLLPAQSSGKGAPEPATAATNDPYTGGVAKAMATACVVAYGPFAWANNLRTTDVDKLLGENRIRWIETAHFLIGSTLGTANAPEEAEARRIMNADLARMKKRHGRFPDRASKIDPWLRLHLYAHRAEELYAEFAQLTGHPPGSPTHLGKKGKFPLLLLNKRSDVARYLDRFCGMKSEMTQRCHYPSSDQCGFVLTAEGQDPYDEATVHAHFRYQLIQAFCDAAGIAPYWLSLGLAHWYERQVPSSVMIATIKAEESVDETTQNKWGAKMRKRAQHQQLLSSFRQLAIDTDFGYWDHLQAWSWVDFLMTRDRARFGAFIAAVRNPGLSVQVEQLEGVLGMTPDAFDARWREWALQSDK